MESEREGWGGRVRKRHVATLRARTQRTNEQVPPPPPPPPPPSISCSLSMSRSARRSVVHVLKTNLSSHEGKGPRCGAPEGPATTLRGA